MKILYITTVPETFFCFFGPILKRLGSQRDAILLASSSGTWITDTDVQHRYGVPVHGLSISRSLFSIKDLTGLFQIIRLNIREKPGIIHASTPKASFLSMLSGWLTRVPFRIYTVRGLIAYGKSPIPRLILHWMERLTCALAHKVTFNSESNRRYFLENRLCRASKMGILGNGSGQGVDAEGRFNPENVPQQEVEQLRAKHKIPEGAIVFGFVGRLVGDKGVSELVEAWKTFIKACPNALLLIVGPEKEPRDMLPHATLEYLATEKSVRLTGAVKEPVAYYALMNVLVHPSKREGFPNAVLEAAAMAKPVITTDAPGCIDSIVDGETGLRYPVKDVGMLEKHMERLYKDAELRRKMGEAGRRHVLKLYRPEFVTEDLLYLYEHKEFRKKTLEQ